MCTVLPPAFRQLRSVIIQLLFLPVKSYQVRCIHYAITLARVAFYFKYVVIFYNRNLSILTFPYLIFIDSHHTKIKLFRLCCVGSSLRAFRRFIYYVKSVNYEIKPVQLSNARMIYSHCIFLYIKSFFIFYNRVENNVYIIYYK